jgi:poly(A) polymerase
MTAPQTKSVMDALGEGNALFVGGCVRNTLMDRPVDDIDIATIYVPERARQLLEAAKIRVVPTGIEHGTVTAVTKGKSFEITTLRRDVATDGRRAVVAFTKDWSEDAQRRDFTMNTLLADAAGNIYDPTGHGIADLKAGKVVFVGDPARRIAEDYLRILRFFRFHAVYGSGAPDKAGLEACRAAAAGIAKLSRERVTQEFLKLLAAADPVPVLRVMKDNNILPEVFSASYDPALLEKLCALQRRFGAADVMARLAVLCGFDEAFYKGLETRMIFSGAQKKSFAAILKAYSAPDAPRVAVYRYGADAAAQAFLLRDGKGLDEVMNIARAWPAPSLPVSGDDVKALGVTAGPQLGKILKETEAWWIAGDFTADRAACLRKLKELATSA